MIESKTVKVNLDQINIPTNYEKTLPAQKIAERLMHYKNTGTFDREIIVDENYNLIDGYTTYLVCKMLGLGKVRALRIKVKFTVKQLFDMLSEKLRGMEDGK